MNYLKRYALTVCVFLYMAAIALLHGLDLFPRPGLYDLSRLIGTSLITVDGVVQDAPVIRWNQTRFIIKGKAAPLGAFRGKAIVTLAFVQEDLAPGDTVRLQGWLSSPRRPGGTRTFDERSYWSTKRVFAKLKVWRSSAFQITRPAGPYTLKRLAWTFHKRYRDFWESTLEPEESALLLGTTMGARGILPPSIKEACIRAGVYHIVVVSGQNMSLIVSLGVGFLSLLRIPRRHAFWICVLPVLFYTACVGSDPPVLRAAVMALVTLFVAALGRDIPILYPLFLAAGWILLWEPEALLGASFQLSFGATLAILITLPHPNPLPDGRGRPAKTFSREGEGGEARMRRRRRAWIYQSTQMSIAVYIGIWPLLVHYFQRLSFAGFAANWTVFPLSGALMVVGLLVGSWGVIHPQSVPDLLLSLVHVLVHLTLGIIRHMASWSWSMQTFRPLPVWGLWLYYGFLFGILFIFRRRKIHETHKKSCPRL